MEKQTWSLEVRPEQFSLDLAEGHQIVKNLTQILSEREALIAQYDALLKADIENPSTAKQAAFIRKRIKENRTKGIEAWHKREKELFLRGGQFVDAVKRKEVEVNLLMEEKLAEIEKYAEIKERNRIVGIGQGRLMDLTIYSSDYAAANDDTAYELGLMSEAEFDALFEKTRVAFEQAEAERKRSELHEARRNELMGYWHVLTVDERNMNYADILDFEAFYNGVVDRDAKKNAELAEARLAAERAEAKLAKERAEAEAARKQLEAKLAAAEEAAKAVAAALPPIADYDAVKDMLIEEDDEMLDADLSEPMGGKSKAGDLEGALADLVEVYGFMDVLAHLAIDLRDASDLLVWLPAGCVNQDTAYRLVGQVKEAVAQHATSVDYLLLTDLKRA